MRFRTLIMLIIAFALGALIFNDFSLSIIGYLGLERLNPFIKPFLFLVSNQKIAQYFGLHPFK